MVLSTAVVKNEENAESLKRMFSNAEVKFSGVHNTSAKSRNFAPRMYHSQRREAESHDLYLPRAHLS